VVIAKTIIDMAEDPQHELRLRFDDFVAEFITRLQHDPALTARAASWRKPASMRRRRRRRARCCKACTPAACRPSCASN
ncbi:MAG TPA: hypothetical protein PKV30_09755, partial [Ottowia sp.]|nr:hypothetical protein [Ottowia sp.]